MVEEWKNEKLLRVTGYELASQNHLSLLIPEKKGRFSAAFLKNN